MTKAAGWLAGLTAASLLLLPRPGAARYEHARALGTRCSTCHTTHHPGADNLNAAGRYFQTNRTLAGWKPGASRRAKGALAPPALFARSCASCHGANGEGTAQALPLSPARQARTAPEIEAVIRKGIAGTAMTGVGAVLSAEQIRALAAHVLSLRASQGS